MVEEEKQVHYFRLCPTCATHGRFVSNDGVLQDRIVVHSKQAAQERLKVMQDCDFITDENAILAISAINASGLPDEITQKDRDSNLEVVEEVALRFLAFEGMPS